MVAVTDDLTQRFNAVELVRKGAGCSAAKAAAGGPTLAQAGGPDSSKADDALKAIGERRSAAERLRYVHMNKQPSFHHRALDFRRRCDILAMGACGFRRLRAAVRRPQRNRLRPCRTPAQRDGAGGAVKR